MNVEGMTGNPDVLLPVLCLQETDVVERQSQWNRHDTPFSWLLRFRLRLKWRAAGPLPASIREPLIRRIRTTPTTTRGRERTTDLFFFKPVSVSLRLGLLFKIHPRCSLLLFAYCIYILTVGGHHQRLL